MVRHASEGVNARIARDETGSSFGLLPPNRALFRNVFPDIRMAQSNRLSRCRGTSARRGQLRSVRDSLVETFSNKRAAVLPGSPWRLVGNADTTDCFRFAVIRLEPARSFEISLLGVNDLRASDCIAHSGKRRGILYRILA
jgi:hypothetical protein